MLTAYERSEDMGTSSQNPGISAHQLELMKMGSFDIILLSEQFGCESDHSTYVVARLEKEHLRAKTTEPHALPNFSPDVATSANLDPSAVHTTDSGH